MGESPGLAVPAGTVQQSSLLQGQKATLSIINWHTVDTESGCGCGSGVQTDLRIWLWIGIQMKSSVLGPELPSCIKGEGRMAFACEGVQGLQCELMPALRACCPLLFVLTGPRRALDAVPVVVGK